MSEDPLDDFIRRQAADYNAPPEVPRELMWARIRAARRAPGSAPTGTSGDAAATASPRSPASRPAAGHPSHRWLYWGAGLAAMLAIGIGIGRLAFRGAPAGAGPGVVAAGGGAVGGQAATVPVEGSRPAGEAGAGGAATSRSSVYRLAANVTLSQAEAVLTAYRAEPASRGVDPQLVSWARDVLSSTRLLIDSPAGHDARLRPLLDDLETVLVQIVQLPVAPSVQGERRIIDDAIQQRDVLPRLRTAIPAGPGVVGT